MIPEGTSDADMIEAFESSSVTVDGVTEHAGWWWLSFTDPDRPKGDQFLGACLVKAAGVGLAHSAATWLGLNPGGEMLAAGPVTDEQVPPEQPRWKLLSRAEIEAIDIAIGRREGGR